MIRAHIVQIEPQQFVEYTIDLSESTLRLVAIRRLAQILRPSLLLTDLEQRFPQLEQQARLAPLHQQTRFQLRQSVHRRFGFLGPFHGFFDLVPPGDHRLTSRPIVERAVDGLRGVMPLDWRNRRRLLFRYETGRLIRLLVLTG